MEIQKRMKINEEKHRKRRQEQDEMDGARELAAQTKQKNLTPHQPEKPWWPSEQLPSWPKPSDLLTTMMNKTDHQQEGPRRPQRGKQRDSATTTSRHPCSQKGVTGTQRTAPQTTWKAWSRQRGGVCSCLPKGSAYIAGLIKGKVRIPLKLKYIR